MIRVFGHFIDIPAMVLGCIELGVLFILAVLVNGVVADQGFSISHDSRILAAALVTGSVGCGFAAVGLYNREHLLHWEDAVSRVIVVLPLTVVTMLGLLGLYDSLILEARRSGDYILCVASAGAFLPILLAGRRVFLLVVDRTQLFTRRILVIGSGVRAAKIDRLCRQHRDRSFAVVGYVRIGEQLEPNGGPDDCRRRKHRRDDFWVAPEDLLQFCREKKIDELVVASSERRGMPVRELLACKLAGLTITEYASFWEREAGQVDLDEITPSWMVFSTGFRVGLLRSFVKRVFDIQVSLLLLVLTLPITLITAILVKLESPGPLFYKQERVGLNGESFTIMKFRSMRADAEKDGPRWAAKNDTRVTRIGAFIRKVRIDEIPQVLNVLTGDMGFVGPRPERPVFVKALAEKIPYYMERHVAKPGITGWAQINYPYGATEEDAKMKLSYDLYYIKNGSLFLDVIIIMQTVKVLLWNSGAR